MSIKFDAEEEVIKLLSEEIDKEILKELIKMGNEKEIGEDWEEWCEKENINVIFHNLFYNIIPTNHSAKFIKLNKTHFSEEFLNKCKWGNIHNNH